MRNSLCSAIAVLLFFPACQKPGIASLSQFQPPVEISVKILRENEKYGKRKQEVETAFEMALRDSIANYVSVVPDGEMPPKNAVRLDIKISGILSNRSDYGTTGIGFYSYKPTLGGPTHTWISLHWDYASIMNQKFGYVPPRIRELTISFSNSCASKPFYSKKISGDDIRREMRPLDDEIRHSDINIRRDLYSKEWARAFAMVVAGQLQKDFKWAARSNL
jgi:hypothetical protein